MSVSALMTRPCVILRRTEPGSADAYGNLDTLDDADATVCELQQRGANELGDGEISDDTWQLFLPAGTELDTGDAVVVDGQTFDVVGAPWPVRHPLTGDESHVQVNVERTAGPEAAS